MTEVFYACGQLLGDRLVIAESLDDLVEACLPGYPPATDPGGRAAVRREWALHFATTMQAQVAAEAGREERFSIEGADDNTLTRIFEDRSRTPSSEPWNLRGLPLIIVRPDDPAWKRPAQGHGTVVLVDVRSAGATLKTWLSVGLLSSVGRLTAKSKVTDPWP
jgi:hypothetical protein